MSALLLPTLGTLFAGSIVGFTLGLIGGGGSILATPLLIYLVGVDNPHIALGTAALAVSVNAYINLISHARKGHVRWRCAAVFAGMGVAGSWAGSTLGMAVDGQRLLLLFGLLMLFVAANTFRKAIRQQSQPVQPPHICVRTAVLAVATGTVSGFFGIGGGFLIVPALMFATGMPMINAIGSSLLAVGTFGLATALNYAHSGFVDWKIAAEFIAGGVVGGIFGMIAATRLSGKGTVLNRLFAAIIAVVGVYVIYKSASVIFGI